MIFSSKKIGQPLLLGFNALFRICIQFDGVLQQIETFICGKCRLGYLSIPTQISGLHKTT